MLQIEADAPLLLIVLVEVAGAVRTDDVVRERRDRAGDVGTPRALDADDVRTEQRELERRGRSRPHPAEVGDAYALEWRASRKARHGLRDLAPCAPFSHDGL